MPFVIIELNVYNLQAIHQAFIIVRRFTPTMFIPFNITLGHPFGFEIKQVSNKKYKKFIVHL